MSKLFDKELSRRCEYCEYGLKSPESGEEILCVNKGVVKPDYVCRKYKYDPMKRTPKRQKIDTDFTPDDFKI